MPTQQEHLIDWLRDAHAMEQQSEQMLSSEMKRIENYPELKTRISQHIDETRRQQEELESCLRRLGSSPSAVKDLGAKVMAFGQAASGVMMSDEIVKGAMSCYVFENMEIASYKILIAAAAEMKDPETEGVARRLLAQEEAMAKWLLDHLPTLTSAFLARTELPGATAKR